MTRKEPSVYWKKPYGWRAGTRYIESGASAADVIRHEQGQQETPLNVPSFLLSELEERQLTARDVVWVCKTRQHARRYASREIGKPYKEDVAPNSLILATDGEPETGYLLLQDATRLDPEVIGKFENYRREKRQERKEVQKFPNIPVVTQLAGYHVTDDPGRVISTLQLGIPLEEGRDEGKVGDLQTSGLYFSEAPNLWTSRSEKKWEFATTLTKEQRDQIANAVLSDNRITGKWYLTDSEKERAARYLQIYRETGNVLFLQFLADQPFNFRTWEKSFLSQIDITNPYISHQIQIRAEGNFADVSNVVVTPELIASLKEAGYDGVFVTSGLFNLPQSVVWNNAAVLQCGEYRRPAPEEGTNQKEK